MSAETPNRQAEASDATRGHPVEMRAAAGALFTLGVLGALVVAATVAACIWWMTVAGRRALDDTRHQRAQELAGVLAAAAQGALRNGDLADLRLTLRETAATGAVASCRVELADGTAIADSSATAVANRRELPERWPEGAGTLAESDGELRTSFTVPTRGLAVLIVQPTSVRASLVTPEVMLGGGGICVAGVLLWGAALRRTGKRVKCLTAVRSALLEANTPGASADSLTVADTFGAEAVAWNTLIAERDRLRSGASLAEAESSGRAHGRGESANAAALDGLWLGVMLLDGAGKVEYANGAAGVMLRTRREALLGRELSEVVTDQAVLPVLREAMNTRQRASAELVTSQDNQERAVLRLTVKALRRGDVAATMMLLEDVTQQRVADESRNAFVSQATHELRTPLTNMRLYVETLVDEGDTDPAIKARCLNVISGEVRRLERIVGDMLSVSEIEAGSLRIVRDDVQPATLLEEVEADFRAQAEDKEISLSFELPPRLDTVRGDRDKLTLALHNLIGNALKYTPAGGEVKVVVQQTPAQLSIAVTDNGIGIKPEECELIFDRFYRAKDKRLAGINGSGLGLALARQIAHLHEGDVTVRSALDKGSTFTLVLPTQERGTVTARAA